jgi:TonB family protein
MELNEIKKFLMILLMVILLILSSMGLVAKNDIYFKKPRLIYKVAPSYPKKALRSRVSGFVIIRAFTNKKGNVVKAEVIEGHQALNEAALKAVKEWKYEPYILKNERKTVEFIVIISFKLNSTFSSVSKQQ